MLALADYPRFVDSVVYQVNGLLVVFFALGLIWVLMETMGWIFRRLEPKPAAAPAAPPLPEGPEVPPQIIAAISAAVVVALGPQSRVIAISRGDDSDAESARMAWSSEGRRQIHGARRVR